VPLSEESIVCNDEQHCHQPPQLQAHELASPAAEVAIDVHVTSELARDRSHRLASEILDDIDDRLATQTGLPEPTSAEPDRRPPAVEPPDLGIDLW
jgi:hypothetical protein